MSELTQAIADAYIERLLLDPEEKVEKVEVNQIHGLECEAVIRFASGATVTFEFDLPAPMPLSALPTLVPIFWVKVLEVEQGMDWDLPALGHSVH